MFYNARYYDPQLRRFISADTRVASWQNPQNLNRYSYVDNAPTRFTDESGHCKTRSGHIIDGFRTPEESVWCGVVPGLRGSLAREDSRAAGETASFLPGADVFADAALCGDSLGHGSVGGSFVDCGAALIPFVGAGFLRRAGGLLGDWFRGGRRADSVWNLGWGARGDVAEDLITAIVFHPPRYESH